ncbi:protein pigeon-like [Styela clava]
MLIQENLLIPSRISRIQGVYEQGPDGTFLYSCLSPSNHTEIRLFELATERDTLMYKYDSAVDIVNASLNPDRNVIAFTIFEEKNSEKLKKKSVDIESELKDQNETTTDHIREANVNWITPISENSGTRYDNMDSVKKSEFSLQPVKGKYKSYLADIYPSKWLWKFNVNRSFYQKVIFTNCSKQKEINGHPTIENRLLLIMHQNYIAMYTIYLKCSTVNEKSLDKNKTVSSFSTIFEDKVEIHDKPRAVSVGKCYWSQWDYSQQQLYYLHVKKSRKTSTDLNEKYVTYSTSLCCDQYAEEQFQQQVFSCSISLDLEECFITCKDSLYEILNMEATVSSSGFNMKVLRIENGMICLCWQSRTKENDTIYRIAVINKDIVMTCVSNKVECDISYHRLSFSSIGNNILIHSPQISVHLIAIDALSSEHYNFKQHCHYLANTPELPNIVSLCQLPYPVPNILNNDDIGRSNSRCYVYDQATNKISIIYIERESIGRSFFSNETTLENKIAIARFASIAFLGDSSKSTLLTNVLLSFLEKGMILRADKILATLLLHNAANDLCSRLPDVEFLRDILPLAIDMPPVESDKFTFVLRFININDDICHQISQAVEKSKYTADRWQKSKYGLKHGSHLEPYDTHAIDEEIYILGEDSSKSHQREQKSQLKERLNTIFEREFLKAIDPDDGNNEESILDCFSSHHQDHIRENLMALTFEKLSDHLKQHLPDNLPIKSIARNYITAQLRAVNHFVCLFICALMFDEPDRGLFEPICPKEKNLLQLLNQLFLSCTLINFPIPTGFQTCLTCLTFRSCFTTHLSIDDNMYFEDSSSSGGDAVLYPEFSSNKKEDIESFSFEFFQKVDCKSILLTREFVARFLKEIPNHETYGSLIIEVLQRTNHDVSMVSKQPHLTSLLARVQMKKLLSAPEKKLRSDSNISGSDISFITPSQSGFSPYDRFLDFLRHWAENCGRDVSGIEEATMQYTIRKHGKEALKHISH